MRPRTAPVERQGAGSRESLCQSLNYLQHGSLRRLVRLCGATLRSALLPNGRSWRMRSSERTHPSPRLRRVSSIFISCLSTHAQLDSPRSSEGHLVTSGTPGLSSDFSSTKFGTLVRSKGTRVRYGRQSLVAARYRERCPDGCQLHGDRNGNGVSVNGARQAKARDAGELIVSRLDPRPSVTTTYEGPGRSHAPWPDRGAERRARWSPHRGAGHAPFGRERLADDCDPPLALL